MADESGGDVQTFALDLDNEKFLKAAKEAAESVKGIGHSENLSGLLEGLGSAAELVGIAGVAMLALKATMDLVFDGEKIEAVNRQFDMLAKNAGVAGKELKEGLVEATHGLADNEEILQAANKALVSMGANASKIPEVMELARKATNVFGGDLIGNFENINQAISSGNMRLLKHMGIIVDSQKAYRDYAKSIGVTVDSLSESGKQAAIMEAVLKKGKTAFGENTDELHKNKNAWTELKVSVKEAWDVLAELANHTLGGVVSTALKMTASTIETITLKIKGAAGDTGSAFKAMEKDAESLRQNIDSTQKKIDMLKGLGADTTGDESQMRLYKQWLKEKEDALEEHYKKEAKIDAHKELATIEKTGGDDKTSEAPKDKADQQKVFEQRTQFEASMLKLREQRLKSQQDLAQTDAEVTRNMDEQQAIMAGEHANQLDKLKNDYEVKGVITKQQYNEQKELMEQEHLLKMQQMNDNYDQQRLQAIDNYEKHATSASNGFARGFMGSSRKAAIEVQQFSKMGAKAFDTVHARASDAFVAMGEGSAETGDLMRGFLFGSLADIAEAQGRLLLASVLVNPLNGVAGAALLVLSGVLRAQAKGSKGAGGGGGGGGGGGDSSPGESYSGTENRPDAKAQEKKAVNINFAGSYYETDQSRQRIAEIVRDNTDATDFSIKQIGT